MARILLGVTGSVAAIKTPLLYRGFIAGGHEAKVIPTEAALYFFEPGEIRPDGSPDAQRDPAHLIVDADEWPGKDDGRKYTRGEPVLHIELRRWGDILIIAPLDANTLAKLANGIADNCLSCVWRAWDRSRPVVIAPAMNTMMWNHPATARHLRQLAIDLENLSVAELRDPTEVSNEINHNANLLRILGPQEKRLACEDIGMGAMAEVGDILKTVEELTAQTAKQQR